MLPRILLLLFTIFVFINGEDEVTLRDLVRHGEFTPIFDTLSAAVGAEYAGQTISSDFADASTPNVHNKVSFRGLNANYSDILLEHDIRVNREVLENMLQDIIEPKHRTKRQAYRNRAYPSTIWSGGVPYAFSTSMNRAKRIAVMTSIKVIHRETCVRFYPRKNEKVYLYFVGHDQGCWSTVGRDASQKQQWLSIGDGCEPFGISSHEVLHALGLFHEQSRYDRDKFIQVLPSRVPNGLYYNFAKVGRNELKTYNVPYEIGSVMHYGPFEFSTSLTQPSVIAKDINYQWAMGSLSGPTFLDLKLINSHYNCHRKCRVKITCVNGGYQNPNNCRQCKCPTGFGGIFCAKRQKPSLSGCGGIVRVTGVKRKFRLRIKRKPGFKRFRKCIYHFVAPKRQRIVMHIKQLHGGVCESGCWEQGVELKAARDKRPTGFRFCCKNDNNKRIVSADNKIPLFLFTRSGETGITFTFQTKTAYNRGFNSTWTEPENEETTEEPTIEEYQPEEEEEEFTRENAHDDSQFNSEMFTSTKEPSVETDEKDEMATIDEEGDLIENLEPEELVTDEEVEASKLFDQPIDLESFYTQSGKNNEHLSTLINSEKKGNEFAKQ